MSDDLIASLKMFQDSMQGLAVNRAVNNARDTADAIRTSDAKEGEQRTQMDALARDLALKLTASGAPATTVQNAFSALSPKSYSSAEQALLDSNIKSDGVAGGAFNTLEQNNSMRESQANADNKRDIQKIYAHGAVQEKLMKAQGGSDSGAADQGVINRLQKSMFGDKNYVAAKGTVLSAEEAKKQIDLALQNPNAKNAIPIIMTKLINGGQRINKTEIEAMGGSKAVIDRAKQAVIDAKDGTLSSENASWMKEMADRVGSSATSSLDAIHKDYANKATANSGLDMPTAYKKISGYDMPGSTATPQGASASTSFGSAAPAVPKAPTVNIKKYLVQ
jgi:hypothetical protein